MKPPKSAGKRVQWAIRLLGCNDLLSARYDRQGQLLRVLRLWRMNNPEQYYELVKITTEPVAETKKRKSK